MDFVKSCRRHTEDPCGGHKYNAGVIVEGIREAAAAGAKVIVLPELVIHGIYLAVICFCRNIFWSRRSGRSERSRRMTAEVDAILFVGLPLAYNGKLYNVAAVLCRGEVLGFVPKTYLPNYNEFLRGKTFCQRNGRSGRGRFRGRVRADGDEAFICVYVSARIKDRRGALRGFVDAGAAEYPSCQKWCDAACESVRIR